MPYFLEKKEQNMRDETNSCKHKDNMTIFGNLLKGVPGKIDEKLKKNFCEGYRKCILFIYGLGASPLLTIPNLTGFHI